MPRLELIAEYAVWVEERDSTYQRLSGVDEQVQTVIYDSTGVVTADIQADRVWYYGQTHRLIADGRVVIAPQKPLKPWSKWRSSTYSKGEGAPYH